MQDKDKLLNPNSKEARYLEYLKKDYMMKVPPVNKNLGNNVDWEQFELIIDYKDFK